VPARHRPRPEIGEAAARRTTSEGRRPDGRSRPERQGVLPLSLPGTAGGTTTVPARNGRRHGRAKFQSGTATGFGTVPAWSGTVRVSSRHITRIRSRYL